MVGTVAEEGEMILYSQFTEVISPSRQVRFITKEWTAKSEGSLKSDLSLHHHHHFNITVIIMLVVFRWRHAGADRV